MRLRAIELDQFRKFDRPVRLDGLGPGINVLCGPNEHGKSTLLAALRAVLFEKHSARGEAIRSYQHHRGSTAPSVALEFEHDGALHRIEKRFLSRPSARLVSAGTAYDGDAAEERLARLLGISAPTRAAKGTAEQTASIWGALLVGQGDSFAQARLGEGARTTLSDCLEAELGTVSGGAAIGRLLKQVKASLSELLDGFGKPRAQYKAALQEQDAADAAILLLEERRVALGHDLAAAADARRALAREADPAAAAREVEALAAARRRRDAVLGHRDRLAQAEADLRLARAAHDDAQAEQSRRNRRSLALAEAERDLSALRLVESDAVERADAARTDMEIRRAAYDAAGVRQDEAERAHRLAVARLDAADRCIACEAAAARLAEAEALSAEVDRLAADLSRFRLDEDSLRTLQAAQLADRGNQAALHAQATTLELSLSVATRLLVEGEPPGELAAGPVRLSLTRTAELVLPGLGQIRIVPASRDQESLHAAAQETARTLRRRLDAAGCADLAHAERLLAERRAVAAALDEARRTLGALLAAALPADPPGSRRDTGIDALRRHVAALRLAMSNALAGLGLERAPDRAAAQADHDATAHAEEQARTRFLSARDTLISPGAAREIADAALRQAELDRYGRAQERDRLAAEHAAAVAAEAGTALAERLRITADELSARRQTLSALTEAAPEGTPALADAAIRRLEEAQANRRAETGRLREEIARLESRIAREEGIGLDEQIDAARRQREIAARLHEHHRREAAILTLLRDTLAQADREARERYLAPLMTRLSPYLQALFPRARLSLREDFLITALSRLEGGEPDADGESFDSLSHGTREQIAILSRLAFADMLLAGGRPAFLVLDDALAFADPVRMERMFDILNEAGRRLQILVLTCREDVASGLGGTRITLRDAAAA